MSQTVKNIAMLSLHSSPIGSLGTKDTGGMSVYIRELARELGSRGHRIDIFTRHTPGSSTDRIDISDNVRLIYIAAPGARFVSKAALYPYLYSFFEAIESFRDAEGRTYDLIHSHYWLSGRIGLMAQKLWGVPHYTTFHTLGALKNSATVEQSESLLRISVEKKIVRECTRIVVAAEREKKHLADFYAAPQSKVAVVPCGVNMDIFKPVGRESARERLHLGRDDSVVLYVGRFDPLKGINCLLSSLRHLRHLDRLKLLLAGGDSNEARATRRLKDLASKLGIANRVRFEGQVDQALLPRYYSAADVTVMPSHYESFGLVTLESLACGTPVIATAVGAAEQLITNGKTGCIIKSPAPHCIARGIEDILVRRHDKLITPESIRASVSAYSWSRLTDIIINEYSAASPQRSDRVLYTSPCLARSGSVQPSVRPGAESP